jgi:hypothetical protein
MNLKALMESGLLTAESKEVIEEQFKTALAIKEKELEESFEAKLVEEKAGMLDTVMEMVEEAVADEMQSIAEEVKHARTLEVQYAEKLETFKEEYAQKQDEQMKILVAESIAEEMEAIQEDIEAVKKHEFVMEMFNTFKSSYEKLFGASDINVYDELEEAKSELDQLKREKKINELLESVTGKKRQIAETILESVETEKLDSKFESIKSVLLAESQEDKQEGEVISESEEQDAPKGTVVLENEEEKEKDVVQESAVDPIVAKLQRSLKIATKR